MKYQIVLQYVPRNFDLMDRGNVKVLDQVDLECTVDQMRSLLNIINAVAPHRPLGGLNVDISEMPE